MRQPGLPPAERDAISRELTRRYSDGLLNDSPGGQPPFPPPGGRPPGPGPRPPRADGRAPRRQPQAPPPDPRPTWVPGQPPAPGPPPPAVGPPAGWPAKPRRRGRKFLLVGGLISFVLLVVIVAAALAAARTDSNDNNGPATDYASECIIPGDPAEDCATLVGTLVGASCGCRDNFTGIAYSGTAS